jgi:hypothetical protein
MVCKNKGTRIGERGRRRHIAVRAAVTRLAHVVGVPNYEMSKQRIALLCSVADRAHGNKSKQKNHSELVCSIKKAHLISKKHHFKVPVGHQSADDFLHWF